MSKTLVANSQPSFPAITLPNVSPLSSPLLAEVTDALGVPRDVVAADEQIEYAWSQLPRLIRRIPPVEIGWARRWAERH
jgi:hypothetical protein